jgi:hypothetical protein
MAHATRVKVPTLPLVFAAAGTGYYLATLAQKPATDDAAWERHMRDARFALGAGLGAGALLWLLEP